MLCNLNKAAWRYLVYSGESLVGLRVPARRGRTSFFLARGPRPEGGALVTRPRPMVHCAPALPLAGRRGSFFQIEAPSRCSVSGASGGAWVADLTVPRPVRESLGASQSPERRAGTPTCFRRPPRARPAPGWGRWAFPAHAGTRPCFLGGSRHGDAAQFLHEEERGEGEEHPGGGEMQVGRARWESGRRALLAVGLPPRAVGGGGGIFCCCCCCLLHFWWDLSFRLHSSPHPAEQNDACRREE